NWVNNALSWELDRDNTNLAFMAYSPLATFLAFGPEVFVCPSDRVLSALQRKAGWSRRVRSMALNSMVGDPIGSRTNRPNAWNPDYRQYLRVADISNPSGIFTFLDENADSIEHGYFWNSLDDKLWSHLPASYHRGAGSVAFMDGHVESHRWQSTTTRRSARPNSGPLPFPVPLAGQEDFDWLAERTSERE
ncbi:MAG TPA: prepilin-type cleavage/methylation domain-containing protein, partial [Verrucomicrobiales bacterium]|nr:prepilin-type cleavage/methylation domain-containing protein [Verrucomicrobiales bacterium]